MVITKPNPPSNNVWQVSHNNYPCYVWWCSGWPYDQHGSRWLLFTATNITFQLEKRGRDERKGERRRETESLAEPPLLYSCKYQSLLDQWDDNRLCHATRQVVLVLVLVTRSRNMIGWPAGPFCGDRKLHFNDMFNDVTMIWHVVATCFLKRYNNLTCCTNNHNMFAETV